MVTELEKVNREINQVAERISESNNEIARF